MQREMTGGYEKAAASPSGHTSEFRLSHMHMENVQPAYSTQVHDCFTNRRPGPPANAGTKGLLHPRGTPADHEHVMAAGGESIGRESDVPLDPREIVCDDYVSYPQLSRVRAHWANPAARRGPRT